MPDDLTPGQEARRLMRRHYYGVLSTPLHEAQGRLHLGLARQEPVHRRVQLVLAGVVDAEPARERAQEFARNVGFTIEEATSFARYFGALANVRLPYEFVRAEDIPRVRSFVEEALGASTLTDRARREIRLSQRSAAKLVQLQVLREARTAGPLGRAAPVGAATGSSVCAGCSGCHVSSRTVPASTGTEIVAVTVSPGST